MSNVFNDSEMQEIFEGYLVETREILESLTYNIMELENNPDDLDLVNTVFRSFHTVKGTSSFMGFDSIASITHHAEDILNKIRRGEMKVNLEIIDTLLEVQDWITIMIDKIIAGDDSESDVSQTIEKINHLKNQSSSEIATEFTTPNQSDTKASKPAYDALDMVLNNANLSEGEGDFSEEEQKLIDAAFSEMNASLLSDSSKEQSKTHPQAAQADEEKIELNQDQANSEISPETENTVQSDLSNSSSAVNANPNAHKDKKPSAATESIRVDVSRVEALMDLSGELVLSRNRLQQLTEKIESKFGSEELIKELVENTSHVDFITSEVQSAIMRMRMVPIGKLFQKAPRIIRDLSKEFGKSIKLELRGEETEIDRTIIEELNDPLVHMIRNSCDHGIESAEIRVDRGKDPEGTITLEADQEGNNIVLRLSDDGSGMDPQKLKDKAIEKGVITSEQAVTMSDRDAYQLIFAPGFSTAAVVSTVSGRGVGMDVVCTNIQRLKGMIDIESKLGAGTTFIIKLPLTLAIIQGLLVRASGETFAIPLSSVIEVVSVSEGRLSTVNGQEVIRFRDEVLPIVSLAESMNLTRSNEKINKSYVVNVGVGTQRLGLIVDELRGQQEIVIKSLGDYLGAVRTVAGSTILGDGRVIMIIDVAQIIRSIFKNEYLQFETQ